MLSILKKLYNGAREVSAALTSGALVRRAIEPHSAAIMDLQRLQLFEGRASSGEDIRPYYTEDLKPRGFFHSQESAERYAAWKGSLSYPVTTRRNPAAPNLYIDGRFHAELAPRFTPETFSIVGTSAYAKEIIAKYGQSTFGLTAENWAKIFRERGAANEVVAQIDKMLTVW